MAIATLRVFVVVVVVVVGFFGVFFPVQVCLFHAEVAVTTITGFVCRNLRLFQAKVAVTTIRFCLFVCLFVFSVQVFFCVSRQSGCHDH